MKERNKKKHLEEANGKDQKKQKEKVDTKPQNLLLYKAEAAGSAARECGGEIPRRGEDGWADRKRQRRIRP